MCRSPAEEKGTVRGPALRLCKEGERSHKVEEREAGSDFKCNGRPLKSFRWKGDDLIYIFEGSSWLRCYEGLGEGKGEEG